ncbi:hypothetical protein R3I93_001089 [Phoxinus phoxinus]|uniref:Uncharacterized protein n=1 Tax=Phoxinus phoxinus TaxID=58324 RepID=A0AAN9DQB7_9TELE
MDLDMQKTLSGPNRGCLIVVRGDWKN